MLCPLGGTPSTVEKIRMKWSKDYPALLEINPTHLNALSSATFDLKVKA